MKTSLIICVFVLILCMVNQGKADCPAFKDCGPLKTGETCAFECAEYLCHENGSYTSSGCPTWQCRKQKGYKNTDFSKPYPECCPGPICDD